MRRKIEARHDILARKNAKFLEKYIITFPDLRNDSFSQLRIFRNLSLQLDPLLREWIHHWELRQSEWCSERVFLLVSARGSDLLRKKNQKYQKEKLLLRSKKAGRFKNLLGFARSNSIVTRRSVSLSCCMSHAPSHHTLPAFLNLNGRKFKDLRMEKVKDSFA